VDMEPSPEPPISVFVISDVRFYRDGLARVLAATDQIALVGGAAATDEGLRLVVQLQPDVVLLDTATADGSWMAQRLADAIPTAKVVALAVPQAEEDLILLVEAGVLGYVTRDQSLDDVVATIVSVVREELVGSPTMLTLVVKRLRALAADFRPPVHGRLTTRELEIVDLIAEGLSNKQIARQLHIEGATVKNHVHNILEKLQVSTRMAAVAEVRRSATPGRSTGAAPVAAARSLALTLFSVVDPAELTAVFSL
jgi:two-component system nitrate/nitrite response regulator NarL